MAALDVTRYQKRKAHWDTAKEHLTSLVSMDKAQQDNNFKLMELQSEVQSFIRYIEERELIKT